MRSSEPFVTVISGPSGVGKTTIADRVLEEVDGLKRSISYTTRPAREGERDGENYFFVSSGEFQELIDGNKLIEWAEVYGNLYGSGYEYVKGRLQEGLNLLLEIDVIGGEAVKRKLPESVLVMVVPPSLKVLEERLRGRRTDEEGTIQKRLDNAINELRHWRNYDYVVVNDGLDTAVHKVAGIISSEIMRRERIKMIKIIDNNQ